jgi:hypothetical protein
MCGTVSHAINAVCDREHRRPNEIYVTTMLVIGELHPMEEELVQEDVKAVDMTPFRPQG